MVRIKITDELARECNSKDGVPLKPDMLVWHFDPYDSWALKQARIAEVHRYGPTLHINGGTLLYHRDAVWVDKEAAYQNGPPFHIYHVRVSRTEPVGILPQGSPPFPSQRSKRSPQLAKR